MAPGEIDPHGDRLVRLIGDDDALANLLVAGDALTRRRDLGLMRRRLRLGGRLGAAGAALGRLPRADVLTLGLTLLHRLRAASAGALGLRRTVAGPALPR